MEHRSTNTLTRDLLGSYTAYATPAELAEESLANERAQNVGTSLTLTVSVSASVSWTWTWT